MNNGGNQYAAQLEEIRREFDQAFTMPASEPGGEMATLVAIRAGGEALALETNQISGLVKHKRVIPIPSRAAAMLGIAGIRGTLVPVYSLAAVLGLAGHTGEPQWLALVNREAPVALAFDELEGRVQVPRASCRARTSVSEEERTAARHYIRELARVWSSPRGIVDVPAILEAMQQAAASRDPAKEL